MRKRSPFRRFISSINWGLAWPFIFGALCIGVLVAVLSGCATGQKGVRISPFQMQLTTQIAATAYLGQANISPELQLKANSAIDLGLGMLEDPATNPAEAMNSVMNATPDPLIQDAIALGVMLLAENVGLNINTLSTSDEMAAARPYIVAILKGIKIALNR